MKTECFSKTPGKLEECKRCKVLASCCREHNKYLTHKQKIWPGRLLDKWYKEENKGNERYKYYSWH